MKNNLSQLPKNKFIKNVVLLTTGTAAAQIVGAILSPIITRLYGPEAYGLMGTFSALVSMIAPIAALTYPIAIVLPKTDEEAKILSKLSIIISMVISIIFGLILFLFHQPLVQLFHLRDIESYLFLIPLVIFTAGALQVIEQWFIRTKQFGVSATATFLQTLISNTSKIGIGVIYPSASVLIVFSAIIHALKAFLLLLLSKKSLIKTPKNMHKDKASIKEVAKKYKDFPLYRSPQAFTNSLSQTFPILMLTAFFGPVSVGYYNIGITVLNIPTQLVGKSVGDVFYPKISAIANNGQSVTKALKKATMVLVGIGVLPYVIIIAFAPMLFSFVFGSDWIIAGEYARWIALWSFSSFISQPVIRSLPVLGAQRFHLMYTIASLVIRFLMLGAGYYIFTSDIIAIGLFSLSSGILNIALILITFNISRGYDQFNFNKTRT